MTRLHRIINEVTLDEMFSAPNNAVDIGQALNEGKVILVSTDADGLQDLSPIFGKYFIAQVMNAGLSRGSRQRAVRRPIHFYIDECAPYVDDKLAQMLTTIRSYGIGVMMAFQGEWQMKTFTPVVVGNTAIKIVGAVDDDKDAGAFANSMRTTPEFIMAQKKQGGVGRFACYTRDLPSAISIALPFGKLDEQEHMADQDYQRVRALNRSGLMAQPLRPPQPDGAASPPSPRPAAKPHRKCHVDPDAGPRTQTSGDWEP
ncbi:MAG: TraM recognition domain-containing protein [Acidobacteriaceae bacterium]